MHAASLTIPRRYVPFTKWSLYVTVMRSVLGSSGSLSVMHIVGVVLGELQGCICFQANSVTSRIYTARLWLPFMFMWSCYLYNVADVLTVVNFL